MAEAAAEFCGGCLCGAVKITVHARPIGVRACWCLVCQGLAAGGATVNAIFPVEAVKIEGKVRYYESEADSGNWMRRGFCPICGTDLTSASNARPSLLIVRAGALDQRDELRPQATIWTRSAPAWACFDPNTAQFEVQPPPVG